MLWAQHWRNRPRPLTYGELLEKIEAGKVAKIERHSPTNSQGSTGGQSQMNRRNSDAVEQTRAN